MSAAREARQLLRAHRYGALSTLSKKFDGHPFGSISPYLTDHDGSLLILISTLAEHTKNIQDDPRVSLITHNQDDPHIQAQGRVTVVGEAGFVAERDLIGFVDVAALAGDQHGLVRFRGLVHQPVQLGSRFADFERRHVCLRAKCTLFRTCGP